MGEPGNGQPILGAEARARVPVDALPSRQEETTIQVLKWGVRFAAVALAYLVCLTIAYGLFLPAAPPATGREPVPQGAALLVMAVLDTAVVGWLVLRARPRGWRLVAVATFAVFAVQTLMPQVESLIFQAYPRFAGHLPVEVVPRLIAAGLLHACLWVPLAVGILGRWRGASVPEPSAGRLLPADWGWKLPLAALGYVAVYFTFGYYVAWRSPAVPAYYGGTDPGSFAASLAAVLRDTPWLPVVQAVRGLAWALLARVVVRTLQRSTLEGALLVGVLFAVVMNAALLLPNPYMPFEVRMAHLVETASSNFLFGAWVGWLLRSP